VVFAAMMDFVMCEISGSNFDPAKDIVGGTVRCGLNTKAAPTSDYNNKKIAFSAWSTIA
jgi:hypothetical protein